MTYISQTISEDGVVCFSPESFLYTIIETNMCAPISMSTFAKRPYDVASHCPEIDPRWTHKYGNLSNRKGS